MAISGRWLIGVATLALVGGGVGVGVCQILTERAANTKEIRREIERKLPRGSSQVAIIQYLDSIGAEYDPEPVPARLSSLLEDRGVPGDALYIGAILRNVATYPLLTKHVMILFVLQDNGTLDRAFVIEIGDSL